MAKIKTPKAPRIGAAARNFRRVRPLARTRALAGDFLKGAEGGLFLFGLSYALAFFCILFIAIFTLPGGQRLLDMVLYQTFTGRMAGLTTGLQKGLPVPLVLATAIALELLLTFFFYPLAIYSTYQANRIALFRHSLNRSLRAAREYQPQVQRYGSLGLILFIFVPVYLTGPLVAAIIGRLIGLSHRRSLLTATIGTLLSVLWWTWSLQPLLEKIGPSTHLVPVGVLVALLAYGLYRFLKSRRSRIGKHG